MKTVEWERPEISSRKLEILREHFFLFFFFKGTFHVKMGIIKDRNSKALTEAEELRRGGKNTQKNCTKRVLMTWITTVV